MELMTKQEVLNIEYINRLLEEGYTVKEVRTLLKEQYNLTYIQFKIITNGYGYNQALKKYVKYEDDNQVVIGNMNHNNFLGLLEDEEEAACAKYVIENIVDLKNMLQTFMQNSDIIDPSIKIDLDGNETIPKTLRINKNVAESFEKFCSENNKHSKGDLISMALKEYMDNHTKM